LVKDAAFAVIPAMILGGNPGFKNKEGIKTAVRGELVEPRPTAGTPFDKLMVNGDLPVIGGASHSRAGGNPEIVRAGPCPPPFYNHAFYHPKM